MSNTFNTVPTELVEHADHAYTHFDGLGYRIKIEPYELGYPKTPTLQCKRQHTTVIVEICAKVDIPTLRDWSAYCRSTDRDLRIAICVPESSVAKYLAKTQLECQRLGIGIYVSTSAGLQELVPAQDLSLQVQLPDIKRLPKQLRVALGSAYEQFGRQQWREGFEEACKALENRAKEYLIPQVTQQILSIIEGGVRKNVSEATMRRMTLGQLANTYGKLQPQTLIVSLVHKTLAAINSDRVGVAHKISERKTEKSLRRNVGMHMHAIVQAFRHLP